MWQDKFKEFVSEKTPNDRGTSVPKASDDVIMVSSDSEDSVHIIQSDHGSSSSLPSLELDSQTNEDEPEQDCKNVQNEREATLVSSESDVQSSDSERLNMEDRAKILPKLTVQEACSLILNGDKEKFISEVPVDCVETSSFIVDTSALKSRDDVRIHLSGAMRNNRVQRDFISLKQKDGEITDLTHLKKKPSVLRKSIYRLTRTYWTSNNTMGFKRRLYELHDHEGNPTRFVILQYIVEGDVPDFKKPHGNVKKSTYSQPYVRTSKRVLEDIQDHLKAGKKTKETFDTVFEEAGGVFHMKSPVDAPRNTKQIYNVRQTVTHQDPRKDNMYQIIKECKDQQSMADPYIRVVQSAPEFRCVLASDLQLLEMEYFVTNPSECTVLGIDPTFNLGEFVVTPIVYKHLKLIHRRTNEPPVFLGPVLIHQTKTESSYDFFASSLVSLKNSLADTLFIGTDDEIAIFNSFSKSMPIAQNLQCKRHVRQSLERKLNELGINSPYSHQFIKDVFERDSGLVDCLTDESFEERLGELEAIWKLREIEATKTTEPKFYSWFCKYKKDLIRNTMRLPLRISSGLGFAHFTTNANESLNSKLKQRTNYKECELPAFCDLLRKMANEQKTDTERSIIDVGPYQIRNEYLEYLQPASKWYKLSESTRKRMVTSFLNAPLKPSEFRPRGANVSVADQPGTSGISKENEPKRLSEQVKETQLNQTIYGPMFEKAENLVKSGMVVRAPGTENGFMVGSDSTEPRFVKILFNGKGSCKCEGFKTLSLCSHILAAAEFIGKTQSLLTYIDKNLPEPNLQQLSKIDMPQKPQRKPNQKSRTSKRKPARDFGPITESVMSNLSHEEGSEKSGNVGYHLKFLMGTQIRSCYGCGQPIRIPPHVPQPPFDIVICQKEYRTYYKDGELKLTLQPQNVYYHCKVGCVLQKHEDFDKNVISHKNITERLSPIHRAYLAAHFEMTYL